MSTETTDAVTKYQPQGEPILAVIERAARDPGVDVDKMAKLLEMAEKVHARQAESAFDAAMNACQSEMRPVSRDSNNPQTRSKYASYGALDQAVRPIYSTHGFALSFGTRSTVADRITVTCRVSHRAGHSRDVEIDMPSDGKGAKGGDVMTKTHATGSAVSYGMRYLLKMIFNIALGEYDDDGNAAGRTMRSADPESERPSAKPPNGKRNHQDAIASFIKWLYENCGPDVAGWAIAYLRTHTPDGGEQNAALMPNEDLTALSENSLAAIRKDMVGFLARLKAFAEANKPKSQTIEPAMGEDYAKGQIIDTSEKPGETGKRKWILFGIKLKADVGTFGEGEEAWFNTFSKTLHTEATRLKGQSVTILMSFTVFLLSSALPEKQKPLLVHLNLHVYSKSHKSQDDYE